MGNLVRLARIAAAIAAHLAWWALVRLRFLRPQSTPPQRLCRTLERLGTTFVKLGQGLGLRRDLLPDDYVEALQGLQDQVAPFAGELARREVEHALGRPIEELFAEFEPEPMAAASIAQVHRARLHDGRAVIVKVRRPGIKSEVARDMRLLRLVLRAVLVVASGLRRYALLEIVAEIGANLRREMDFRQEAGNIQRFAQAFQGSTTVQVPAVAGALYSESVLVQVRSGGRRIDDPSLRADGPRLARAFVEAYLYQFFVLGVFHADPHPGNLFITEDGRICFHDFGLVGFLDVAARRGLAGFMQAFAHKDGAWLLDACLDLGVLGGAIDRAEARAALDYLVDDYASRPLGDWSFAEALLRIARMGRGRNVRVPHKLLVLARALFLAETTVRSLDPSFNLVEGLIGKVEAAVKDTLEEQAGAAVRARLRYESALLVQELSPAVAQWVRRLRTGEIELPLQHKGLEGLELHFDRASNRIALAVVSVGLYLAASLLMADSPGPRFGDVPAFAAAGFALALWFTLRIVRGIRHSGRL